MDRCCRNCLWFVSESDKKPDEYNHKYAREKESGFCLQQDFFTIVNPDDYCGDYYADGENTNG